MKKRVAILVLAIVLSVLVFPGCFTIGRDINKYYGPHADLNTVVMNSVLGATVETGEIIVLDEDSFGRRLFAYGGESKIWIGSDPFQWELIRGIFISQKTDKKEGYVYYYPDYNYLVYAGLPWPHGDMLEGWARSPELADDIEWLKEKNDWEMPFDESKCVRAEISERDIAVDAMLEGTLLVPVESRGAARTNINWLIGSEYSEGGLSHFTSDEYGRYIYYSTIRNATSSEESTSRPLKFYIVMFGPDGSFDPETGIIEVEDIWDCQDELKAFKERNGWNTPP